ncbi:O-methyltransferase [Halalkalicoccus tibetensis]|uniref:O-methyltransferase n=1 Tax=Halalkalicoccus tibetensis TaxID=175632 RepID=A0ABD5V443_9EURY
MAHLADDVLRFVRAAGPQPDDVLEEMDEYAEANGFPHVGPAVGGFLRLTARLAGAESVFEFGSGYGYSAYWFADALPENGEIVLTEVDEDELEMAREHLSRGGYDDLASYELGDALDTIERYDGPFDAVLIDHQKHRYPEALEAVRDKLAPGAVVIADNTMSAGSAVVFEDLLAHFEGQSVEMNEGTRGVADYLDTVRADPAFETMVLPLGEGIAVSRFEG